MNVDLGASTERWLAVGIVGLSTFGGFIDVAEEFFLKPRPTEVGESLGVLTETGERVLTEDAEIILLEG